MQTFQNVLIYFMLIELRLPICEIFQLFRSLILPFIDVRNFSDEKQNKKIKRAKSWKISQIGKRSFL